jgi:hypothetical protein
MKTIELNSINRFYFGYEDIARALKIRPASARVSASRYVRLGLLMRLKRNIKDFKVKLGSIVGSNTRVYYVQNRFSYLMERLSAISSSAGI